MHVHNTRTQVSCWFCRNKPIIELSKHIIWIFASSRMFVNCIAIHRIKIPRCTGNLHVTKRFGRSFAAQHSPRLSIINVQFWLCNVKTPRHWVTQWVTRDDRIRGLYEAPKPWTCDCHSILRAARVISIFFWGIPGAYLHIWKRECFRCGRWEAQWYWSPKHLTGGRHGHARIVC